MHVHQPQSVSAINTSATMICSTCEGIDFDQLDAEPTESGYYGYPHHASFAELAACGDCDFCIAVVDYVAANADNALSNRPRYSKLVVDHEAGSWQQNQLYMRIFPSSTGIGDESDKSNLLVYSMPDAHALAIFGLFVERVATELETWKPNSDSAAASLIGGRPVSEVPNEDECFEIAKSWLHSCLYQHEDCSRTAGLPSERLVKPTFFPSRVIDVGLSSEACVPRLVVKGEQEPDEPWVTLSHRWGSSVPFQTTVATLTERTNAIPLWLMPATFKDAITITRKLGFRYVWIDSLCIIQDDKEDWELEAARMGNTYRNSQLHIAANTGHGCHDGIFTRRTFTHPIIIIPLISKKMGIDTRMFVRYGRWDMYRPEILGGESTLSSRGWCMQESILAPRTLHYAKNQMFFECGHSTLAEGSILPMVKAGPSTWLSASQWVSNKMVLPKRILSSLDRASHTPVEEQTFSQQTPVYNGWKQVVMNYMQRQLTFQSDIFVALAGIASLFQDSLKDRYLAGMFERDIMASLLWRAVNASTRRQGIKVPSWSWASVIGAIAQEIIVDSNVITPKLVGNMNAKLIECGGPSRSDGHEKIELLDFEGCHLTIEGHILHEKDSAPFGYLDADSSYTSSRAEILAGHKSRELYLLHRREDKSIDVAEDATVPDNGQTLAILHLGSWEWTFEYKLPPPTAPAEPLAVSRVHRKRGGLLLRSVDETCQTYQRVGIIISKTGYDNVVAESVLPDPEDALHAQVWQKRTVTII